MAPLAATSPEATKVLFEGLPFRLNEPLPLRMRGKMGPKCPLAANKPMLVMIVKRSWNWVWLPTYLQVLFLDYLTGVCLNFIHHRIHGLPVLSSWYLEADSRIFAALHLWPQPGDDIQINGKLATSAPTVYQLWATWLSINELISPRYAYQNFIYVQQNNHFYIEGGFFYWSALKND